jgi:general secretion pathway protein H
MRLPIFALRARQAPCPMGEHLYPSPIFLHRDVGFSMVEMLVVLAILAAVLTVALPQFKNPGTTANLNAVTVELAAGLKALRARAIGMNREETFTFDADAKSFSMGQGGAVIQLPRSIAVTFETAREAVRGTTDARLIFFPTGGSSGARIALSQDQRRSTVVIDWMTGAVSIERGAP